MSATIIMVFLFISIISCGNDDNNKALEEYVGTWICTSPSGRPYTLVEKGTTLVISSTGDMTWTMSDGKVYNAKVNAKGDGFADITYNGKTYEAEMYVRSSSLAINVNGNNDLKVKDFPFDGSYKK